MVFAICSPPLTLVSLFARITLSSISCIMRLHRMSGVLEFRVLRHTNRHSDLDTEMESSKPTTAGLLEQKQHH